MRVNELRVGYEDKVMRHCILGLYQIVNPYSASNTRAAYPVLPSVPIACIYCLPEYRPLPSVQSKYPEQAQEVDQRQDTLPAPSSWGLDRDIDCGDSASYTLNQARGVMIVIPCRTKPVMIGGHDSALKLVVREDCIFNTGVATFNSWTVRGVCLRKWSESGRADERHHDGSYLISDCQAISPAMASRIDLGRIQYFAPNDLSRSYARCIVRMKFDIFPFILLFLSDRMSSTRPDRSAGSYLMSRSSQPVMS